VNVPNNKPDLPGYNPDMPTRPGDELYAVMDREAKDEAERHDSKILYDALQARRGLLGGATEIPTDDRKLSEQILAKAQKRSAELSDTLAQTTTQTSPAASSPIPWWLWLAWIIAIAGAIAAYMYLV
jgi:hypothetical protein